MPPFESENQRKAMYAAAAGKSNIGIPKSVGEKFIKHKDDGEAENLEWLNELLLKEMEVSALKEDSLVSAPVLLAPTEFETDSNIVVRKGELSHELRKLQIKDIGEKLYQVAQHIKDLKKDDDCDEEVVPRFGVEDKNDADPCWENYIQYGMKEKDGKSVPNCVPDAENEAIEQNAQLVPELPKEVKPEDNMGGAQGRAAGIMFITPNEEVLMIRRGMGGGDYPGTWCIPGGHQKGDETLEECARRECLEETGIDYKGKLEVLYDDGQFCYYVAHNFVKEEVKLNYESSGSDWCSPTVPPMPLHPGLENAFKIAMAKTETDVAKLISEGLLASPQMYANIALLAIRITGTGLAFRSSIGEHVWRDPSLYLNNEFLARCNGLMVIMDHPETQVLTTKEFKDRAVGSILLPYIKGDEVWGIAKIYDQDAIKEILEGEVSTSPAVVFDETAGNMTLTTENGEPLLIEGVPFLLDHIAIVTKARGSKGVWDKGGDAAGVLLTNNEVSEND
jgi:8-oxo-dGTP pyrophosphatase MutT (NUDIX family)